MFKTATVTAAKVPSTQTNFPAYVDLARLGVTTLAEAQSIRVYADSGKTTEWPREIVNKDTMHVKVTSLTSTVSIYVDWDGVRADYAVTDTYGRNSVWTAYWGVWHMTGANASTDKKLDSTGNSRSITEFNTPATPVVNQWGDTDGAYSLQGVVGATSSTVLYDYLDIGKPDAVFGTNTPFTVSTGFNLVSQDTSTVDFIIRQERNDSSGRNSWGISILNGANQNKIDFSYSPTTAISPIASPVSTNALSVGAWNHIVGRRRASDYYPVITLNNVHNVGTSGNGAAFTANNNNAFVNRRYNSSYSSSQRYATGYWAELRIRADDPGDDFITTEYNNQSDEAGFWGTWSTVGGGGAPAKNTLFFGSGL
jgi:hypothetical protein